MSIDNVAIELIISFSCQGGDGMGIDSTKQKSKFWKLSWFLIVFLVRDEFKHKIETNVYITKHN